MIFIYLWFSVHPQAFLHGSGVTIDVLYILECVSKWSSKKTISKTLERVIIPTESSLAHPFKIQVPQTS